MRIAVVSGTFHPEPGGPPAFLYRLLPELVRRGHTVEVVTYGEADAPRDYPYRVTRISRRRPIPLRLPALARAVLAAGRRADIFLVSDYGLPVALANIFLRRPIVLKNVGDFAWEFSTRHGWIPHGQTIDQFQTAPHSLRVRLLRRVRRWYTGAASVVVAPSHYSARLVVGWGIPAAKVKVIYNALDPVISLPSHETAREQLALGGGPVLLTVARLVPWKGIDGLIRALPVIRQQFPAARLVIVGDGPERAALQAQAAPLGPAVQFTGALPPAQVWPHLRAADVFVLFSTYEGLPHTVLEAMQAGTPVVVSDAGGNVEVVTGGETGWVAPAGDERALAAAILEALSNPQLAAARAAAATIRLNRFSWLRLVDEYEAALSGVLKR
ncbi:MAG: glycosyltransferase family 4 protein [Chloroflexi bacterium]|nr:glycosyltransferase family 4 protein [Chloroflexota bacterium]